MRFLSCDGYLVVLNGTTFGDGAGRFLGLSSISNWVQLNPIVKNATACNNR